MATNSATSARNRAHLTADLGGTPDEVFTYLTDHFFELWPGKASVLEKGSDPAEPMGLGMVRRMHPPGSAALEERIITHDRPRLIEYQVINDAPLSNHLGRLELTPTDTGVHLDYTIDFDYKPAALGPVVTRVLTTTWAMRGRRRLKAAFPVR